MGGTSAKERKAVETKLESDIFAAVKAKDSSKLKASYEEFIKVADLKSEYKPGELGQTDSSGYSPTWGTDKQFIYQR
jgi:Photosystem II Psb31 protein